MNIHSIVSILLICWTASLSAQIPVNTWFDVLVDKPIDGRMTLATIGDTTTIDFPANGLLAYIEDSDEHWYYNGSMWVKMEGGKIDSVYVRGDSMFVSETGIEFYIGASDSAIGSGITDYVARWASPSTLSTGALRDDGSTISTSTSTTHPGGYSTRTSVSFSSSHSVPSGATGTHTGILQGASTTLTANNTSVSTIGGQFQAYVRGSYNTGAVTGILARAGSNNGTNTVGTVVGVMSGWTNSSTSSTMPNVRMFQAGVVGTTDNATITNATGFYFVNPTYGTGTTVTNAYGVYLEDVNDGSSLNYALYTNAGKNYFGDNVGIKTTSAAYSLDMSGVTTSALRLPQTPTSSLPIGANGLLTFDVTTGTYRAYSDGAYRHFVINDLTSGKFTNKYIPFANSSGYLTEYASFRLDSAANILYTPSNIYAYDNTGLGFFRINSTSSNYSEVYQNSVRGLIIDSRASGMAGLGNNGSTSPGFNVTNVVFGTRNGQGMAARFAVSPGSPTAMTGVGLGWISGSGSFFNNTPSSDTTIYANTWRSIASVPSGEAPGYAISARRFQIYVGTGAGANSSGNYALKTIKYDFGFSTARIIPKTVIGSTTRFPRQALDVIGQVQIDTIEYEEDADYNIVSNASGLLQKSSRAYAALKKTSTTTLTLGVTDIRVAGMTSGVSQNITLTDSTATLGVAGIYEISYSGSVSLSPGGSGTYLASFSLYQNSTELVETTSDFEIVAASAGNYYSPISGSTIMSLSASDVISLRYNGTTSTPSELRNISITIKKI